jgi:trans-aconitate methyltransferase
MGTDYVHGYTPAETRRLTDQAQTLADLLHAGISYPAGSRVLEAGCGVGAQTVQLVTRSPGIDLVSVDISEESLAQAKARVMSVVPEARVDWRHADLHELPEEEFDHIFVCFVLEHLPNPHEALVRLRRLLKPGGTITVIEGDHESAFFHPRSPQAQAVIDCLVDLQAAAAAAQGRRVRRRARLAVHRVRRRDAAASGRRVHPEDVHRDGRVGPGASDRGRDANAGRMGAGHP